MGEKDFSDRAFVGDDSLSFVSRDVFRAVRSGVSDPIARAELVADLCRINTLFMIMQAGSGHIGSSFSSTDIITWLWTEAPARSERRQRRRRRLFLVEGPRRAGALLAADRDRKARLRSAAEAAPAEWPAGPSRRQHAVHRRQHRLARHGHLQGLRHGARQSLHRPQRPHRRHDRRRRAAGRPDLGIAAAGARTSGSPTSP